MQIRPASVVEKEIRSTIQLVYADSVPDHQIETNWFSEIEKMDALQTQLVSADSLWHTYMKTHDLLRKFPDTLKPVIETVNPDSIEFERGADSRARILKLYDALIELVVVRNGWSDLDRSIELLSKTIRQKLRNGEADKSLSKLFLSRGILRMKNKDGQYFKDYNSAIKYDSLNAHAYFFLGQHFRGTQNLVKAISNYQYSISQKHGMHQQSHYRIGETSKYLLKCFQDLALGEIKKPNTDPELIRYYLEKSLEYADTAEKYIPNDRELFNLQFISEAAFENIEVLR